MNIVIFLYYLGCTILIIMLGKFFNQPVPETHWLILFLGVILGIVFKVPRRQAFLYGFICGFSVALVYILSTYIQSPIMTQKIAKLFGIQPVGLILIMALLQGFLLGLAAFTGAWLRKIL